MLTYWVTDESTTATNEMWRENRCPTMFGEGDDESPSLPIG